MVGYAKDPLPVIVKLIETCAETLILWILSAVLATMYNSKGCITTVE